MPRDKDIVTIARERGEGPDALVVEHKFSMPELAGLRDGLMSSTIAGVIISLGDRLDRFEAGPGGPE